MERLDSQYHQIAVKTNSLHNLSEVLMKQQKCLKEKKALLKERLHYFDTAQHLIDNIDRYTNNICHTDFLNALDQINECIQYMSDHVSVKMLIYWNLVPRLCF